MEEAGSQKFVSEMRRLLRHETDCWSRRIGHTILVGLFLTSCHGAFAQDYRKPGLPSWDTSDNPAEYELDNPAEYELGGGLWPQSLKPNKGASAPSGSAAANFYGPASETSGDVAARLFPALGDPVGHATEGFQRVHGLDGATGDSIEAVDEVPSSFSDVSNIPFSSSGLGSNGNPGGVPGLGRGPFSALGNALQGGNGNLMNTVLQGLAFVSMLQDLLASFSSAGAQFNASNTGRSAFMAASNLLGIAPGAGGSTLPFGGSNSFTNAAAQRLGESTLGVPGTESGNLACAWVVNDIFRSITGSTIVGPNGNPLSVYDTVRAMEGNPQMFTEVSREQAIASGRDYVSAWNPAWGGSASHIVYGRGDQGIGNSSGSRSIGTQGIGGQHARYFIINQ